jgi:hypothetical protein
MFILNNGSLFIFKNSTIILNKQFLGFDLTNYTKINIFEDKVYFASNK